MMKKIFALSFALLFTLVLLAGCGGGDTPADAGADSSVADASVAEPASVPEDASVAEEEPAFATSLADIQAKGMLVIGLDDTFAPMGFRDTDNTLVGFDIDLARAVCEKLGVEAEFQPIDWNAKEMELNTGNIDCIWNGMSATPERQESMSLSQNYLNNKMIVMTNPGVTIASKEDMANFNIGIQGGSAALEAVKASEVWDAIADKVVEYPTYDEIIMDMNAGRIDCVVIDEVFGNYKNAQMDNVFGTADFDFGDDLYAIGFRKSDTELTDAVNTALNELIAEGTAAEISTQWFGTDIVIGA